MMQAIDGSLKRLKTDYIDIYYFHYDDPELPIEEALRAIGDSKDSRTKVARMKEQTIEGLKKNIGYFQTKRAALQEELRRPTLRLTDEQKRKGPRPLPNRRGVGQRQQVSSCRAWLPSPGSGFRRCARTPTCP